MKAKVLPVGLVGTGILLMLVFHRYPRFEDSGWQKRVHEGDVEGYFQERDRNVTIPSRLWHFGAGLAALGLTLGAGFKLLEIDELDELATLTTPPQKMTLFVLANIAWLGFIPVKDHWSSYTMARGDYPWWSDATIAGMIGSTLSILFCLPVINAGLALCLSGAELPTEMWRPPESLWPKVATLLAAVIGLMSARALLSAVVIGDAFAVPLWCSLLFVLLSARAAAGSGQEREIALSLPGNRLS